MQFITRGIEFNYTIAWSKHKLFVTCPQNYICDLKKTASKRGLIYVKFDGRSHVFTFRRPGSLKKNLQAVFCKAVEQHDVRLRGQQQSSKKYMANRQKARRSSPKHIAALARA